MAQRQALPLIMLGRGRSLDMARTMIESLKPEVDVVHVCLTQESSLAEVPKICSGDLSTVPACELGSNLDRPPAERLMPKAISFGGQISTEDRQELQNVVKQEMNDPPTFVGMTIDDVKQHGEINGANIAIVIKEKLRQAGLLED